MLPDRRVQRMVEVVRGRLARIRCATETLHHRHNASALLRTAEGFGVSHVHLVGDRHFRPSKGPARGAPRWLHLHHHDTVDEGFEALQDAGFAVWVADLDDRALPPEQVPLDRPIAVWMGTELAGVSDRARQRAEGVIHLPMHGFAESLNISVAAALILRTLTHRLRTEQGTAAGLSAEAQRQELARWLAREDLDLSTDDALTWATELLGGDASHTDGVGGEASGGRAGEPDPI